MTKLSRHKQHVFLRHRNKVKYMVNNNFLQLFFGWEAVGLVSYLLIGFWFDRPTAIYANMKAFLVNRVGDLGFMLGIAAIVYYCNTLDYAEAFAVAPEVAGFTMQIIPGVMRARRRCGIGVGDLIDETTRAEGYRRRFLLVG